MALDAVWATMVWATMSALAIVGVCVGGVCGYCLAVAYVSLRLLWYFNQTADRYSTPGFDAAALGIVLPLGLAVLLLYATGGVGESGIPPRSVRQAQALKKQREEIARLEHELGIRP